MEDSPLKRNTLTKAERLCGKTNISRLLYKGRWINLKNVRCCYSFTQSEECNKIVVSVPKKLFKRAVKRNLLKRRIKESYRLQKHNLSVKNGLNILFVYSTIEVLDFDIIFSTIGNLIQIINKEGEK